MGKVVTVPLSGALAGHTLQVDPEAVTLGVLEDLQSQEAKLILDALGGTKDVPPVIVGGDLPQGVDRAGLRRLRLPELQAIVTGVLAGATGVPKS